MAKFWVGRSGGSGGAGWIGKVYFDKPKEYETFDPTMIERLRNSTVTRELEAEDDIDACPDVSDTEEADEEREIPLSEMTLVKLREMCKMHGLSTHGKKTTLVSRLEDCFEDVSDK